MQRKISTITLCYTESTKEAPNDKSKRVDVNVTTEASKEILIEVKTYAERYYFSRILHSTSKVITTHIYEGEVSLQIPPVISVKICYFPLGHGQDYLYKVTKNFTGMHYGDTLDLNESEKKLYLTKAETVSQIYPTYYIIKVDSFEETIQCPVDKWVYFFKTEEIKIVFTLQA